MQTSYCAQVMSQPMIGKPEIPSGTLIDNRYMIQHLLGQGGLGRTYLAFDTRRFNEPCVLKEFAPRGSGAHSLQKSRDLFKREAEILYQIHHPQIPNFLACFEGDGRLFLVQEYVDGRTYSNILKEYRKQGSHFSEAAVIDWLNKLLPVLEYIHQHDIIHRDISPDNIMLPAGRDLPVLIDFGVGKQVVDGEHSDSGAGGDEEVSYVGKMSLVGKIGYAPHEQIRLGICSPSSDLYALGVTAVVMLTCKDPYVLMNQYTLQWQWRSYTAISVEFGQILDKMLADTPSERYQTSREVMTDLHQLAQSDITRVSLPEPLPLPETMVVPPLAAAMTLPPQTNHPETRSADRPTPKGAGSPPIEDAFIQQCQDALAYYIGPMAAFVIEETMQSEPQLSRTEFIDSLTQELPDPKEALEFRKRILG